jgi:glycosyltransferase involved in cell wall biosynthesis
VIDAVAVVVPVNNEGALLPACIAGIRVAIAQARHDHPEVAVKVCFALDRCSDDSAHILSSTGFQFIQSEVPGVGAARAAGAAVALRELGGFSPRRVVIACTDADSRVPAEWISHQIDLANEGADVVVGPVRPDDELDDERRSAWAATHLNGQATGHVHGANLGIRANVYSAAGGFAAVDEHEDVDLVMRAAATGAIVVASDHHCVVTSARLHGRTAGGYAGYLRDHLLRLAPHAVVAESVAQ